MEFTSYLNSKMSAKRVDLDDVLQKFGLFSRYHTQLLFFIGIAYATNSMYCSNYVFAAQETKYRCVGDENGTNTCSDYASSECIQWVYSDPYSFVAEFQIACQEWKRTLVGTIHSLGYMVGLLFVGPLSDRFGRKKMIVVTGVTGGVLGIARSFTTNYWLYIFLEFLESAFGDICSPVYILNIEIVATKRRVPYYCICGLGYCFGGLFLPLVAYFVPYWRNFLRVLYAPALLFFTYMFLIDESPRWLLTKGKIDKAVGIIEKAADKSKVKLDLNELENLHVETEKSVGFVELFKITFSSSAILKRCVICIIWWTTSTFVNYGMTINSVSLEGNKYLNFGLVTLIQFPGFFIIMYILLKFKRKIPLIASFFAGAILCIAQPFIPSNIRWLSILVYMIGKLMASFYFNITYMYTSELFPTHTRNSMHALCSSLGRIGSIIAPQTPLLMVYWSGLPSVVFGSASLLAGILTFLVPDTANDALPDTVKQAEALGSKVS